MIYRSFSPILALPFLLLLPPSAVAQKPIPLALQPCIRQLDTNRTPVKVPFTRGTYRAEARTYYLLHLFPPGMGFGVRDAIVSSQASRCQVLAQYPSGQPIPVNALIPLSVARGLTLNILKSDIAKLGGPQRYQRILNSASQDTGRLYLDPNKVWALQQLGIRISPSIKILPPPPL